MLENAKDSKIWFGFSKRTLSVKKNGTIWGSDTTPHFLLGNIFEDSENVCKFTAGTYILKVRITAFVRQLNGEFHAVCPETTRIVEVS